MNQASARAVPGSSVRHVPGSRLAIAGVVAFGAILASWLVYKYTHPYVYTLQPVDMHVYTIGGLIVRHVRPWYNPHLASPLYDWSGFTALKLPFTYTPFAALVFAVLSFVPWSLLPKLSVLLNVSFLLISLWFTFSGLGYRNRQLRLGATLLVAAAVFWTEPVIRTIYLGQVNLGLMALVIWDMTQPDRRWWKGVGVGLAAGIKLIPGIFIVYLLATRRFKQAIVASATFLATIVLPFAILPADSSKWWFTGLFFTGGNRAGFMGWEGNQSLRALMARILGSLAGSEDAWLVIAVLAIVAGMICAAMLDRKGYRMAGLMAAALTGLLASPISWDHHWVWIVPCVAIAAHYAVNAMAASARGFVPGRGGATVWRDWAARARLWASSLPGWGCWAVAAGILAVFGAWPGSLWSRPHDMGDFSLGLLWFAPGTGMNVYEKYGDLPGYAEYHWHGVTMLAGNAYVLAGIAMIALLLILGWYAPSIAQRTPPSSPAAVLTETAAEPEGEQAAALNGAAAGPGGEQPAAPAAALNGAAPGEPASPEPAAGQSAGTGQQNPG